MRNRWSLFLSGLIVFVTWYVPLYGVTSRTFDALTTGLTFGLAVVIGGLVLGAGGGVAAHASGLYLMHREVRRGAALGGARVSLGKLPDIVPVERQTRADGEEPPTPAPPAAAEVESGLPLNSSPARDDPGTEEVASDSAADEVPEPNATTSSAPIADRLATECEHFVAAHKAVAVTPGDAGTPATGAIDRAANPVDFAAFMALVESLAGEGVDVARVAVSAGSNDLPSGVTFPVSSDSDGEKE